MSHVLSVKFTDDEWEALKARADDERLYPHGLVKTAVRSMLGLPIPTRLAQILAPRVAA